jgi:L-amino acid N-acyltransferase YncA
MGVDAAKQSCGLGSALLRHAAERCERDRLPAYLEATNPRNRRLHSGHGFEELGVIRSGNSPPMWPMLAQAAMKLAGAVASVLTRFVGCQ